MAEERKIIHSLDDLYARQKAIVPFGTYHVPELGLDVVEHPDVLTPRLSLSGIWTVQNWDLEPGMSVLDMGTGSGIIGVSAIVKTGASKVLSADISPIAVDIATKTAALNNVSDRMSVTQSNLFDGLPTGTVDRIIFNPPFWDRAPDPNEPITYATNDIGRTLLKTFLSTAPEFLSHPDSRVVMVFSTQDHFDEVDRIIKGAKGLTVRATTTEDIGHPRVLFSLGPE